MRPIANEILAQGGSVAWFIPEGSEAEPFLQKSDVRLWDVPEVKKYAPDAVLAPGNYIPDLFPGVKVQVFHGFDSGKKNKFKVRSFFDLYCTQGPNITEAFENICDGTYDVVETGWSKLDALFKEHELTSSYRTEKPLILYAPTFSPRLTSTYQLHAHIKALLAIKDWQWLVKLHPKATHAEIELFKSLECDNLRFIETSELIPLLQAADVLLSDTSSILTEFALQNKPVVALNNRRPEDWMINFEQPEKLVDNLELALENSASQLQLIESHCNAIHPMRDGLSSKRTVEAIENLIAKGTGHLKSKPLNIIRRLKIRKQLKYYRWK